VTDIAGTFFQGLLLLDEHREYFDIPNHGRVVFFIRDLSSPLRLPAHMRITSQRPDVADEYLVFRLFGVPQFPFFGFDHNLPFLRHFYSSIAESTGEVKRPTEPIIAQIKIASNSFTQVVISSMPLIKPFSDAYPNFSLLFSLSYPQ
jgi:hypothetical protein